MFPYCGIAVSSVRTYNECRYKKSQTQMDFIIDAEPVGSIFVVHFYILEPDAMTQSQLGMEISMLSWLFFIKNRVVFIIKLATRTTVEVMREYPEITSGYSIFLLFPLRVICRIATLSRDI